MSDQLLILKISLEYAKVKSAPRKIVVVQHDVLIINVMIDMMLQIVCFANN